MSCSDVHVIKRVFDENDCAIVFSANEGFAKYFAVMLQSIVDNSSKDQTYDIVLLSADIKKDTFGLLKSMVKDHGNFSIRLYDVASLVNRDALFVENSAGITVETYFRLLIPSLFREYARVIYLDGDMVTRTDISELYSVPFDGNSLISSRDLWGTCNCYIEGDPLRAYRAELMGADSIDDYFIAGLLIFNLDKIPPMSADALMDLALSREWHQHDQDVLNKAYVHDTKLLHAKWDFLDDKYDAIKYLPKPLVQEYEEAKEDPKIVHFGGSRKPWKNAYELYDLLFWKTAIKTPFFDDIFQSIVGKLEYKTYLMRHLGLGFPDLHFTESDLIFKRGEQYLGRFSTRAVVFDFLSLRDGALHAEGYIPRLGLGEGDQMGIVLRCGDHQFDCVETDRYKKVFRSEDDLAWEGEPFEFNIALDELPDDAALSVVCFVNGHPLFMGNLRFNKFCAISAQFPHAYQLLGNHVLQTDGQCLFVKYVKKDVRKYYERAFLQDMSLRDDYDEIKFLRTEYFKKNHGDEIWLFSDRTNKADDNGEAFFRYVTENHPEIDAYFILRDDCDDYIRMKQVGKVVPYLSTEHKLLHLLCSVNASAQADLPCFCPFGVDNAPYRDLLQTQKFVFLQHGVIKNDISRWFNRININPTVFVTSAAAERDSLLQNPRYNYSPSDVVLTGLARHDALYRDSHRYVTIMPTWRIWLAERSDEDLGVWRVKEGFRETAYFGFYNNLLNSEKLLAAARSMGYTIAFMLHPNMQGGIEQFDKAAGVKFFGIDTSYRDVFAQSDLVVTDYSSSVMDFSYLRRPVIYAHFDEQDFYSGTHIASRGYFDDLRDGFGEVTYDLNETIDSIIEYMSNSCAIKQGYLDRINRFFAYSDSGACRRIYEAVESAPVNSKLSLSERRSFEGAGLLDSSPDITRVPMSRIRKSDIQAAADRMRLPLVRKYSDQCHKGNPRIWLTDLDTELTVRRPIKMLKSSCDNHHIPTFSDFEASNPETAFMVNFYMQVSGQNPYSASDWLSKSLDERLLGHKWRCVGKGGRVKSLMVGDIVLFSTGKLASVYSVADGRAIFIVPGRKRAGGNDVPTVTVGSLYNRKRSSRISFLPAIAWQIRKL